MKKIIIVGAGVAGLSAGIYARQAGFETVIYEKHRLTGGLCTGWNRKGYHIDGCIHWLTGTKSGTELHSVWKNLNALNNDVKTLYLESFGDYYFSEGHITIHRDIEKFKHELLSLSPEDAKMIEQFIDDIYTLQDFEMPADIPIDMMNLPQFIQLMKKTKNVGSIMSKTGKISCVEYGKKFKHPAIQKMFASCMPEGFSASSYLFSLATFFSGNGGVPQYGSLAMAKRMEEKYLALGGTLHTNCGVKEIQVEKGVANGVRLDDGSVHSADYIISTCDPNVLFTKLLKDRLVDKQLSLRYNNPQDYPVSTSVICSFAVAEDLSHLPSSMVFETEAFQCGTVTKQTVDIKTYAYEKSFAPQGHCVIEVSIKMQGSEYRYWDNLRKDKEAYNQKKKEIAAQVQKKTETCLPQLKGKLTLLDVATPVTFKRYTDAYNGAWMGFVITPRSKQLQHKGTVKGISNLLFAGQWTQSAGGLPVAAVSGKFAIQRICKKEKLPICHIPKI